MDSMDIIRHGKFYSYNGELYANTFPEFWAVHQEPETGTECGNCMTYGSWNGVFCMYCINCAEHVYQGTRGGGVYGYLHEGECTDHGDYFAAANTYLKNVKMDDIGDPEMCNSRAIHGVSEDVVYVTTRYETERDSSLNVSATTAADSTDLRAQRDLTAQFLELEEGGISVAVVDVEYDWSNSLDDSSMLPIEEVTQTNTESSQDEEEYFNDIEQMSSAMMVDPFIVENMYFGFNEGAYDNLNMSYIQQYEVDYDEEDEDEDMVDLPELINVDAIDADSALYPDDDDDELYADMPPLIPISEM
jgi:hypothetical protein